jgi:hypothetical protein
VPACGTDLPPPDPDGSLFGALRQTLLEGDVRGEPGDTQGPVPVVSSDQLHTPSLLPPIQAFRWFIEYGGRHGTGWLNVATRVVAKTMAPFHAGIAAPHLRRPVLMLVSPHDEMPQANPDVSLAAYRAVPGTKQLMEIEGGHFGLLHHPSELFEVASRAQCTFLAQTLA